MKPSEWVALLSADDAVRRQPGAPAGVLEASEAALGTTFPLALRSLYQASDGIWDEPGQWFVIWPIADVIERNRLVWRDESPARGDWIAFGDDGTSNPFCVRLSGGDDVYYWSPIEQEATRLARDLATFWQAWATDSWPPH